jgi:hypothetical protein
MQDKHKYITVLNVTNYCNYLAIKLTRRLMVKKRFPDVLMLHISFVIEAKQMEGHLLCENEV